MNVKIIVAALCLGTSGLAFSATPGADRALSATNGAGLTRAEVLADLAIWSRAGLSQHVHSESGPDLSSPLYRQAQASYLQLRNSAAYTEEVRRIGSAGGAHAMLASGG